MASGQWLAPRAREAVTGCRFQPIPANRLVHFGPHPARLLTTGHWPLTTYNWAVAKRITKGNLWGFIQSRPYASVADIRRLFSIEVDGAATVTTAEGTCFVGLPQDTADLIRQLWQEGRIALDLNPDVKARVIQGVYPARVPLGRQPARRAAALDVAPGAASAQDGQQARGAGRNRRRRRKRRGTGGSAAAGAAPGGSGQGSGVRGQGSGSSAAAGAAPGGSAAPAARESTFGLPARGAGAPAAPDVAAPLAASAGP